jgi:phosphoglycerate dehydrogenase-like enzyme
MAQIRVLILGATPENPVPGLPEDATGVAYDFASTLEEAQALAPSADVAFLWEWHTPLLEQVWPLAKRLRWIHVIGVGIEWALFPALVESDVTVTNTRGVYDRALGEYALLLMLAMSKDLPTTIRHQDAKTWESRDVELLRGRHLVLVGLGSIGRTIGRMAATMGMSVSVVAQRARQDSEFGQVRKTSDLAEEAERADVLLLVAPSTPQTRNLVNADLLARMQPGSRVINLGRGDLVDDDALVAGLRSGSIAGAALDVFREEPLPADHPFWTAPNLILSPHMSGIVPGWERESVAIFLDTVRRWLAGEPLENELNKRLGYVVQAIPS